MERNPQLANALSWPALYSRQPLDRLEIAGIPSLLDELAIKLNTRAENILKTLCNIPEFERVPDRPKNEQWWRIAR